jgi:hypothetical protein
MFSLRLFTKAAALGLGGALACLACDPLDEGPPPATPPTISTAAEDVPAAPPPVPAPAGSSVDANEGDGVRYASDEVTIGQTSDGYEDDDPSALTEFRAALDPHGAWVDDPTYGTVWVPSAKEVGPDFQPYVTAGHWVYDHDWIWASDYGWGWAPFHYGRWVYVEGRGWAWIPGRAYRGAWVSLGVDDGYSYLGWAPLGPAFLWFGGVPMGFAGYYTAPWVYCPRGYVFAPSMRGHAVAGAAAGPVAGRVRPFVLAHPGVGGPSPQSFGYQAERVPNGSGAEAAEISRAQTFARPATAQALGARAPTRWVPAAQSPATAAVSAPRASLPVRLPEAGGARRTIPTASGPARVSPASPSPRPFRGPSVRGGGVRVR